MNLYFGNRCMIYQFVETRQHWVTRSRIPSRTISVVTCHPKCEAPLASIMSLSGFGFRNSFPVKSRGASQWARFGPLYERSTKPAPKGNEQSGLRCKKHVRTKTLNGRAKLRQAEAMQRAAPRNLTLVHFSVYSPGRRCAPWSYGATSVTNPEASETKHALMQGFLPNISSLFQVCGVLLYHLHLGRGNYRE